MTGMVDPDLLSQLLDQATQVQQLALVVLWEVGDIGTNLRTVATPANVDLAYALAELKFADERLRAAFALLGGEP